MEIEFTEPPKITSEFDWNEEKSQVWEMSTEEYSLVAGGFPHVCGLIRIEK